ncbi:MAG: zinc ABC transporter substrate-binding protein [Actinomycetota bacterium]
MRSTVKVCFVLAIGATAVACGDDDSSSSGTEVAEDAGACPGDTIPITVSVNQWGNIAQSIAGDCADITTIVGSGQGDPDDYEPSASDTEEFEGAALVIVNGAGYDTWAVQIVESESEQPVVVNAGDVVGAPSDANPHLWYNPDYVFQTADAITAALQQVQPESSDYFEQNSEGWTQSMQPYTDVIAQIQSDYAGTPIGATESIFDYMATATGLDLITPQDFQDAVAEDSDPPASSVQTFEEQIDQGEIDVLVYNSQTTGAVPEQMESRAEGQGIPVVGVTETVPADASSFEEWQVGQLNNLVDALAQATGQS